MAEPSSLTAGHLLNSCSRKTLYFVDVNNTVELDDGPLGCCSVYYFRHFSPKDVVVCSSETFVYSQNTTQCNNAEDQSIFKSP
jgi:hypothetical protein